MILHNIVNGKVAMKKKMAFRCISNINDRPIFSISVKKLTSSHRFKTLLLKHPMLSLLDTIS